MEAPMRPFCSLEQQEELALGRRDVYVCQKLVSRRLAVSQPCVDEGEHLLRARADHSKARTVEKQARPFAPIQRLGENCVMARNQYRQARDLRDRLPQVPLPQREEIELSLSAPGAKRGRDDLEWISIHEHDGRANAEDGAPENANVKHVRGSFQTHGAAGKIWQKVS